MSNPFYQPQTNLYQALINSKNPIQLFNTMAQTNPQLKPIVDMLNQGISPQNIFTSLCKQRGINPNEFLKQIQGQ